MRKENAEKPSSKCKQNLRKSKSRKKTQKSKSNSWKNRENNENQKRKDREPSKNKNSEIETKKNESETWKRPFDLFLNTQKFPACSIKTSHSLLLCTLSLSLCSNKYLGMKCPVRTLYFVGSCVQWCVIMGRGCQERYSSTF